MLIRRGPHLGVSFPILRQHATVRIHHLDPVVWLGVVRCRHHQPHGHSCLSTRLMAHSDLRSGREKAQKLDQNGYSHMTIQPDRGRRGITDRYLLRLFRSAKRLQLAAKQPPFTQTMRAGRRTPCEAGPRVDKDQERPTGSWPAAREALDLQANHVGLDTPWPVTPRHGRLI